MVLSAFLPRYDPAMPNYKRAFVPGGSFFFTVVTNRQARLFSELRGRNLLCWPWSSFHRWVKAGVCPNHLACSHSGFAMDFSDIEDSVGEPE